MSLSNGTLGGLSMIGGIISMALCIPFYNEVRQGNMTFVSSLMSTFMAGSTLIGTGGWFWYKALTN